MLLYLGCFLFVTTVVFGVDSNAADVDSYKDKLTLLIKEKYDGVAAFDESVSEAMAKEEYEKYTNGEYDRLSKERERFHRSKKEAGIDLDKKRSLVSSDFTFDDDDKELILKIHNDYRSGLCKQDGTAKDSSGSNYPACSDMNYLFWDDALEKVAQSWADSLASSCSGLSHNSARSSDLQKYTSDASFTVPSNAYLGENVGYTGTSSSNADISRATARLTSMWEEDGDWSYQPYKSSTINGAGHFTQMAWADTRYIACAGAMCKGNYYNYYTVCNYYPGGNYLNQYPYSSGSVCTNCDSDRTRCDDSQCGGCMNTAFTSGGGGSSDCNDGFNNVANAGDPIGSGSGGDDDDDDDNSGNNGDDDNQGDDDDDNNNGCTETSSTFCCNDGCAISKSWYQDGEWCDCSNCEDEDSCSCASGGCTFGCGGYAKGSCSSSKVVSGSSSRSSGSSSGNDNDDNTALYIGIGVGAGVVVILLIAVGIIVLKKRKGKQQAVDMDFKAYEPPSVEMNANDAETKA